MKKGIDNGPEIISPSEVFSFDITDEAFSFKINELFFGELIPNFDFKISLEVEKAGKKNIRLVLEIDAENSELESFGITNFQIIEIGNILYNNLFYFNKVLNISQRDFIEGILDKKLEGVEKAKYETKEGVKVIIVEE